MRILATLSLGVLNDIYELTYKYGWIKYDEDVVGWLRDPAYNTKYKMEAELSKLLRIGFEELLATYDWWLNKHSLNGFKESVYNSASSLGIGDVLAVLDKLGIPYEPVLYEIVAEDAGGVPAILEQEDPEYLVSSYGQAFVDDFVGKLPPAAREQFTQEMEGVEDPVSHFIDLYSLQDEFKNWLLESGELSAEQWFRDNFDVDKLMLTFNDILDANIEKIMNYSYDRYLDFFERPDKSMRQVISNVKDTRKILEQAQSSSLDEKIRAFQLGLTTAHNFGMMADHLLGVKPGAAQPILDTISTGPHVEDWDEDLEKLLGHPKGSIRKEVPTYWVEPEKQYLEKALKSSSLRLASVLGQLLESV